MADQTEAPERVWLRPTSRQRLFSGDNEYVVIDAANNPWADQGIEYVRADLARPPQDLMEDALDYLPDDDDVTRITDDGYGGKIYIAPMTEKSWLVLQRVIRWMESNRYE